ncbi:PRC-barrel domain-containing protein [Streptomyces antarcticus]|uniref:PRC-barrel domain-containing protein n=1 Tax=Streptomyces antarcticus TaxID=2996458 RepID=UPI00226F2AF5|nr:MULTISPECIES: PRC-barrel domain-containing protein [unclassified Streptomyces]MCY0946856.1 PRC-barrel domain-containing protein [Streptomyces sp. H34-AA3]MCY0950120.1 PRC-barrel domain-containing protein [Streptomyces sp. H27-S2]MCZ4085644.1 PRC-barrel domain-containing protein [Streptomyces sp. H34-S5]
MTSHDMWNHRQAPEFVEGVDLAGWPVEATDGTVGKVDKHSAELDSSYLVVDTGVWVFGKEVLIPAGTITRIELDEQRIYVGLTRVQIENAPEFDRQLHLGDPAYHHGLSTHYGPGGTTA